MTPDPAQVDVAELRALGLEDLRRVKTMIRDLGDMACIGCRMNTCPACGLAANITNEVQVARNALLDRLEAAEAKVVAVEALADEWGDDHRIRMEAGAIYDLGNGRHVLEQR